MADKSNQTRIKKKYPDYWEFDVTGALSFDRAIGNAGVWENEYLNYYYWGYARGLFYAGLTEQSKVTREKYLGSMFFTLGHICHLLEDQGVPAHTRNDFIWGHMVGGYYDEDTPLKDGGNPFEIWVETYVKDEGNTIPSSWLSGAGSNIPAFSFLKKYWDSNTYSGSYVGAITPDNWGLCERTNYQFLSFSTMFRNDGSLYAYPNPSKINAPVNSEVVNGKKHYYRSGYDVPHLAKVSYSTYTSQSLGYTTTYEENALEEDAVSNDYAQRTIPRTINYAVGLLNYFFRGKLSIEQTDCNNGKIVINITNKSDNSGVGQILKGGTFALYWDDSSGNRTQVTDFTVYRPGTQPVPGNEWNSSTQMNYNESNKAILTPPVSQDVNCILVYEGIIGSDPNSPDSDDTRQIATGIFSAYCESCSCQNCPIQCPKKIALSINRSPSSAWSVYGGIGTSTIWAMNGTYILDYIGSQLVIDDFGHEYYECTWGCSISVDPPNYFARQAQYVCNEGWGQGCGETGGGCSWGELVKEISVCRSMSLTVKNTWKSSEEEGPPNINYLSVDISYSYLMWYGTEYRGSLRWDALPELGYCVRTSGSWEEEWSEPTCWTTFAFTINETGNPNLPEWEIDKNYVIGDMVNGNYKCKVSHLSNLDNRPGSGVNWQTYWYILSGNCGYH